MFFAASFVCQAVFVNRAFFAVEDAGLDPLTLSGFRRRVIAIRYSPGDGTALPITVCTQADLQSARDTAAVRHALFAAAYCVEALAVLLFYFMRRAR